MSNSGVRVELSIDSPEACPVAAIADEAGTTVTNVARSSPQNGQVIEEFTVAETNGTLESHEDVEYVLGTENGGRYRIERDRSNCLCETIETFSCPVSNIHTDGDQLVLTFHAPDIDRTRAIIKRLNELYGGVSLQSLQQNGALDDDSVLVDRSTLTDRQGEVLETAVEMGYFEYPKGANAGEVAEALDISLSTFTEHLAAALSKVLDQVVEQ